MVADFLLTLRPSNFNFYIMANIFENAKFGDKFRTRDGRMALYISGGLNLHILYVEGEDEPDDFDRHGLFYYSYGGKLTSFDIIGKWEEPINKEELKELARHFADDEMNISIPERNGRYAGYQAGFRKAKGL